MEIRDLKCALAALESGSFARAAERLFVSRQALSQTVRKLEAEIDVRLFDVADGNRLLPTAEGAMFLAQARPVVDAFDELARAYPTAADRASAPLTIALAAGVALSLPNDFFERFSNTDTRLVIEFEEGNTQNSLDLLDAGRADVALVGSCPSMLDASRYELSLLVPTGLWLAVPPANPLAQSQKDKLSLADLEGQRLVTAGKMNHLHKFIVDACNRAGVHIEIPATSSNVDMLMRMTREYDALCFTFPPKSYGREKVGDRPEIFALDVPEAESFGTYAVRRRDSRRTPGARRFWVYACEQAGTMQKGNV